MKYQPKYELQSTPSMPGTWHVFNADTGALAGSAYWKSSRYRVLDDLADLICSVCSVDLIVPTVAMHHERHPPRWEREAPGLWTKWTQYGWLKIEKMGPRAFELYRRHDPLCDKNGYPVTVDTLAEAKRLADLHMRQGYPNAAPIDDGLSWDTDPDIDRRGRYW